MGNHFFGTLTLVHHHLLGLALLLPVSPLGKLPKRLGPRVEVIQIGCPFYSVERSSCGRRTQMNSVLALRM